MANSYDSEPSIILAGIRKSKLRGPHGALSVAPIPHHIYHYIGLIVVHHGEIERELDRLLLAAVTAYPEQKDNGWQSIDFRRKVNFLHKKLNMILSDCPDLLKKLKLFQDRIHILNAQRSALVHGHYTASFPKSGPVSLGVSAKPFKKFRLYNFDEDTLDTVYHEMIMVAGQLKSICDLREDQDFSYEDKQILRDRLGALPHYLTNPATLPHQHLSSPA